MCIFKKKLYYERREYIFSKRRVCCPVQLISMERKIENKYYKFCKSKGFGPFGSQIRIFGQIKCFNDLIDHRNTVCIHLFLLSLRVQFIFQKYPFVTFTLFD